MSQLGIHWSNPKQQKKPRSGVTTIATVPECSCDLQQQYVQQLTSYLSLCPNCEWRELINVPSTVWRDPCPENCCQKGFCLENRETIEVELVLILTEFMSCFSSDDLLPSPSNPDAHCRNLFFSVFLPCKNTCEKTWKIRLSAITKHFVFRI